MTRFAMLCLSALPAAASAQSCLSVTTVGDEFDLSEGLTTQRRGSYVAYNGVDGEYLVAWFDLRNQPTSGNDIYAQRVGADGTTLGDDIEVSLAPEAQIDPYVSHGSKANEYFVTWRTQEPGFFNNGRGRRINADGTPAAPDVFVSNAGFESSTVYNEVEDEFFYLARNFAGGGAAGIRARRIAGGGDPFGTDIGVATAGAPAPCGHVALSTFSNRYLCTWRDQSNEQLRGQLVSSDGSLDGGAILVWDDFPASGRAATNAYDPVNQRFLVTFGDFTGPEIRARFIGEDGDPIGEAFEIATGAGNQVSPFVAYSTAAEAYVLVYLDGSTVTLLLLDLEGAVVGEPLEIGAGTAADRPHLAENTDTGEFLIVWSDNRNLGLGEQDIFARLVQVTNQDPGDFNGDGVKNILDFVAFQEAFVSGDPAADCDDNGLFNILDFVCFQGLFQQGCE